MQAGVVAAPVAASGFSPNALLDQVSALFNTKAVTTPNAKDWILRTSVAFLAAYSTYYTGQSLKNFFLEDQVAQKSEKGDLEGKKLSRVQVILKFLSWLKPEYARLLIGMSLSVLSGFFEGQKSLHMVKFIKAAIKGKSLNHLGKETSKLLYYEAFDIGISWIRKQLLSDATNNFVKLLKTKVFNALLQQELSFFDKTKFTKLKKVLDSDTKKVSSYFTDQIPNLIDLLSTIFSQIVVLWSKSRQLTVLMLASIAFQLELSKLKLKLLAWLEEKDEEPEEDNSGDALSNIKAIRVFRREEAEKKKYHRFLYDDDSDGDLSSSTLSAPQRMVSFFKDFARTARKELPDVVTAVWKLLYKSYWLFNLWYGGKLSIDRQVDNEELQTLVEIATNVYDGINQLVYEREEFYENLGPARRIVGLVQRKPLIPLDQGLCPQQPMRGEIVFQEVSFKHPGATRFSLEKLNMRIKAGSKVALVGPSGSGKTTALGLLHHFYDPLSGSILVDSIDIKQYNLHWYYKNIGFISQRPIIFNASIEENIKCGNGDEVSFAEVENVSRLVGLHDVISNLVDGYHTNASSLSYGQQQMVAVARLLLSDPKLLLLDVPSLGLDLQSEQLVTSALETLMKGRTCILISYRLSEIAKCDRIFVFEHGNVIEEGNHQELMTKGGVYSKLVNQQLTLNQDEANVEVTGVGLTVLKEPLQKLQQLVAKRKSLLEQIQEQREVTEGEKQEAEEREELVRLVESISASLEREKTRLAELERKYEVVPQDLYEISTTPKPGVVLKPKTKRELSLQKMMGATKAVQFVNKFLKISTPRLQK